MEEYLSFRKMITPIIIQILFWIGVALCVIMGLAGIVGGIGAGSGVVVLTSVLMILIGPIFVRVYCELIIIMFRIHDVLTEIRDGRKPAQAGPEAPAPTPAP